MTASPVNAALASLVRRAEDEAPARLAETFVDVGAVVARVSNRDSQVIFGRRGTGKTHVLAYVGEQRRAKGETVVSVDLRLIGSTGGIYADGDITTPEAGTRLLIDVLGHVHDALLGAVIDSGNERALAPLERLADAITQVSVIGDSEYRLKAGEEVGADQTLGLAATLSLAGAHLNAIGQASQHNRVVAEREILMRGVARHRVHFGAVGTALRDLVPTLPGSRLWLLLDEWSHVPLHLQPILADLLRHCVLPVPGLTVKIAAIEHRSAFKVERDDFSSYLGFEVGADVAADIDLDDFMVFSSDHDAAVSFFSQLFFRHLAAMGSDGIPVPKYATAADFVREAFASADAFSELVRAGEGVPRDAINIVGKAALKAGSNRISVQMVREAARRWYLQDKEGPVKSRRDGLDLLYWTIEQVIGQRRARAFLLQQDSESHLVTWLYDSRVLHLIKRGISAKDRPGARFDAYALDYGCYVDLLSSKDYAPQGLLATEDESYLDVPPDEYDDNVRGSILDLAAFEARPSADGTPRRRAAVVEVLDITVRSTLMTFVRADDERVSPIDQLTNSGWYLLVEIAGSIGVIEVGRRALKIGSASGSNVRIRNGGLLPTHATLSKAAPGIVLNSPEGALVSVNGRRSRNTPLADRDKVRLGRAEFVLVYRP